MTERVLVTGGAGYLGSILVPTLLEAGYHVTVLDRFDDGATLAACCKYSTFTPVRGDVRDASLMERLLDGVTVVIPLAALVGAPLCDRDPYAATAVNHLAIASMCGMLAPHQKLIFPNSNSGYGTTPLGMVCTEETPLTPVTLYGKTKAAAEVAVWDAGGVSLRLATVFGMSPRMRLDLLVNDFVYRALTDRALIVFEGHARRNYVHIRDVAGAFLHVIRNYAKMCGQTYNVGRDDANCTKLELCAKVAEHVPGFMYVESKVGEDPDKRDYIVSSDKLLKSGWVSIFSLDDGIAELVKGLTMIRGRRFGNV